MNGKYPWQHEGDRKPVINILLDRLLYEMHSPRTSDGRGVVFGRLFRQDGTLVATTAQEGIVRLSEREQQRRLKQQQDAKDLNKDNSKL